MNVEMGRHPVPPGLNSGKVVRKAPGATVPWLFGIALFTYVDRCALVAVWPADVRGRQPVLTCMTTLGGCALAVALQQQVPLF